MRFLFRSILFLVTLAIAMATCVTYFSSFIEPDRLGKYILVQFAFPYLWVANLIMLIFNVLFGFRWRAAIPVFAAIITFSGAQSVFNIHSSSESKSQTIKILTYNIHGMSLAQPEDFGEFIKDQNADIVCLQEASPSIVNKLKEWTGDFPYSSYQYYADGKISERAAQQVVFSKFPIKPKDIEATDEIGRVIQCTELSITENNTITLLNCHLASIGLQSEQIEVFKPQSITTDNKSNVKTQLLNTSQKMLNAFHQRQLQVDFMREAIKNISTPLIICGDFNDTPISYTYQSIRKLDLHDSFCEAGNGLGDTYNGDLPPIRIDYVWHTEDMKAINYTEHRVKISDHYPVTATLELVP